MSRNAKKIRIQILNPPSGARDTTSLEHARRYVKRGVADWEGSALRFIHRKTAANRPRLDVVIREVLVQDSGFNGFLRYPMPNSKGHHAVLALDGAGLS